MAQVEIEKKAIPIVKSGLTFEKKRLEFNRKKVKQQLKYFEKKYKMSTLEFTDKFNAGKLGDEQQWFEWLSMHKALQHITEKLELINNIKL